jgi:peptide/nickel transport system substrate-binding protein
MSRHRSGRFIFLSLLLVSALGAEQAVIYLRLADSLTLDPGKFEDFYSQEVIANVFEGLVRLKPGTLSIEPCLAESWAFYEHGKRWVFRLRRGVRFHDGREFSAAAVVYSFTKRMAGRRSAYGPFGQVFPFIAAVRAVGDQSVEFFLDRPYAPFLLSLVDLRAAIIAPGSADGPAFVAIGTGPFMVSGRVTDKPLFLRRNPFYWDGAAQIDRVIFKSEKSATARLAQIKNHGVHVAMIRSAVEHAELAGRPGIGILSQPSPSTGYLGFNGFRPPFNQLSVRKAFAHLLNKRVMVRRVFQNLAQPAAQFLPPSMPGFDAGAGGYEFSPQKAQKLLRDAGWGKGFSCSLYYSEGQFGIEDIARAIAAKARLVRVTVRTVKLPFERFFKAVQSGEPDLSLMSWGFTADPVVFLNPMFMLVPGTGRMLAVSPEYPRILAAAETAVDARERDRQCVAAQRLIFRELPLLPLFHLNEMLAFDSRLSGLRLDSLGLLHFKAALLRSD